MKADFVLTGLMPLLMHADDVEAADELEAWRKDPQNKDRSRAGDDRSPAWTWHNYLYHDGEHISMPSDNLMVALRGAGTQLILKGQKTYKSLTQSGILIDTEHCQFLCAGKQIPIGKIHALHDKTFQDQKAGADKLGFSLFVKRAKVGQSKHVRVRPRFNDWSVRGSLQVSTEDITPDILAMLFDIAGSKCGLCDWRPSSKTPGAFGMFSAEVKIVK